MLNLMKPVLLRLSESDRAKEAITSWSFVRPMVRRFVAGERLEEALDVARKLNEQGFRVAMNHLGEHVHSLEEAERAYQEYLRLVQAVHENYLRAYLSIKLSQLGLDLSEAFCRERLEALLQAARDQGLFVRIDMESSDYVERTLHLYEELAPSFPNLGVVIQSYLRRSEQDVERLIELGASVRLVKGAYLEPPEVAYMDKREVDRAYVRLLERLLSEEARRRGVHTAIATHDERILRYACCQIKAQSIPPDEYEFQLLMGIRMDLQRKLLIEGHPVRVYLSYGEDWFPYFMRRLAERPANVAFLLKHLAVPSRARGRPSSALSSPSGSARCATARDPLGPPSWP